MFSKKDGLLALIILTLATALVRLIQTKKEQDLELDMAHDTIYEIRGLQRRVELNASPLIEGTLPRIVYSYPRRFA